MEVISHSDISPTANQPTPPRRPRHDLVALAHNHHIRPRGDILCMDVREHGPQRLISQMVAMGARCVLGACVRCFLAAAGILAGEVTATD